MRFLKKLFQSQASKMECNQAFLEAAYYGRQSEIESAVDQGADINSIDDRGDSALINSIINHDIETLKLLLRRGADANLKCRGGYTALITACVGGYIEGVKLLLDHGADVNIPEDRGLKALNVAEDRGFSNIVNLLKEAGGATTGDDSSPCCWTCTQCSVTPAPDEQVLCTLDFRNVKVVSRDHLCSAYEKRG